MTLREAVDRIEALEDSQARILDELRILRRGRTRADEESVVALLEYLHDVFDLEPWTSNQVFEQAEENPLLYAALVRCLGLQPTIQGLSKLLMRSRGPWGLYALRCLKQRGHSGAVFTVTQCVTPSPIQNSRVCRTDSRRS